MKEICEYGKKVSKNDSYIREDIKELYEDFGEIALIFTCRYVPNSNQRYITLGNVRIFDDLLNKKTKYQLTDHINLPRSIVEQYMDLSDTELRRKKIFMVCTPQRYEHYGTERYALKLVTGYKISPILRASTVKEKWIYDLDRLKELRDQYNTGINVVITGENNPFV